MKLLIIAYDMIPYSVTWGGAQRMFFLANSAVEEGIEVDVICCKKKYIGDYGNVLNANLKSIEYKGPLIKNILKNSLVDWKAGTAAGQKISIAKKATKDKSKIYKILDRIDRAIYNEPNFMTGYITSSWIKYSYLDFKKVVQDGYDAFILTGPPFGFWIKAIKIIKRRSNALIILDYRDPWNLWRKGTIATRGKERRCIEHADLVICTNQSLREDMGKFFCLSREKICVIPNGFSEENWSMVSSNFKDDTIETGVLNILYAGSISFDANETTRNPIFFLDALEGLLCKGYDISVTFVGVKYPDSKSVQKVRRRFAGRKLFIKGEVSSIDANNYMNCADVLLLIHTANGSSAKYIVSGKLYDYIRAGKYIMDIGDEDINHKQLIEENGIGISVKNDVNDITEALRGIYRKKVFGNLEIEKIDVSRFSREHQNKKYLKYIKNVIEKKKSEGMES